MGKIQKIQKCFAITGVFGGDCTILSVHFHKKDAEKELEEQRKDVPEIYYEIVPCDVIARLGYTITKKMRESGLGDYVIMNGSIQLRQHFCTEKKAWEEVERICGDKIDWTKSNFSVKKIQISSLTKE